MSVWDANSSFKLSPFQYDMQNKVYLLPLSFISVGSFNGALLTAYLFLLTPNATARKRNDLTWGTPLDRVDSELVKRLSDCAGK